MRNSTLCDRIWNEWCRKDIVRLLDLTNETNICACTILGFIASKQVRLVLSNRVPQRNLGLGSCTHERFDSTSEHFFYHTAG